MIDAANEHRNAKIQEANELMLAALSILDDWSADREEQKKAERIFHLAKRLYDQAARSGMSGF